MNKKGQSLSMNTVIIAILVIIVLVVVVAFFIGGTGSVIDRIRAILTGSTAGSSLVEGKNFCESYCENAQQLTTAAEKKASPYCTKAQNLDVNGDGKAEISLQEGTNGKKLNFYCGSKHKTGDDYDADPGVNKKYDYSSKNDNKGVPHLGVSCPEVENEC